MALDSGTPKERARLAQIGLQVAPPGELAPDTEVLLLRQVYLGHLDSHRFREAAEVALTMSRVGPLRDIAHHDASRAFAALGDMEQAIAQQRLAARNAVPERRSFQYWSLGTLLHFEGEHALAASALERGERWAHIDRPLLRAHRAWVRLDAGLGVRNLEAIASDLERAKAGRGYGQFVLGMLRHHMGDHPRAAVHLRAFLRRNSSADPGKAITLREELHRARKVLAELESE